MVVDNKRNELILILEFGRGLFVSRGRLGVSGSSISGRCSVSGSVITVIVFPVVFTVTIVSVSPLDLCKQKILILIKIQPKMNVK